MGQCATKEPKTADKYALSDYVVHPSDGHNYSGDDDSTRSRNGAGTSSKRSRSGMLRSRSGSQSTGRRILKTVGFRMLDSRPSAARVFRASNPSTFTNSRDSAIELLDESFSGIEIVRPLYVSVMGAAFIVLYKDNQQLHLLKMRALDGMPQLQPTELLIALQTVLTAPGFSEEGAGLVRMHAVRLEAWGAEENGKRIHERIKGWPENKPTWHVPALHDGLQQLWTVEDACEYGSLRFQVDRFSFMKMSGRPNMALVIEAASEIARAMEALHNMGRVHGRLSSSTVFLQKKEREEAPGEGRPPSRGPRGSVDRDREKDAAPVSWRALVGGYLNESLLQQSLEGLRIDVLGSADETSVAHLAPEVLLEGIAGQAADVYAFGLILWELATQKHVPLRAMSLLEVQVAVCREGTRPTFPSTIPEDYVRLANQCWSQLPTARPTFSEIALRLQTIYARHLEAEKRELLQRKQSKDSERKRRISLQYAALAPKYASYYDGLLKQEKELPTK